MTSGDVAMARHHVKGAASMVDLNGGPKTLGLDGFLEIVLEKYVEQVGLRLSTIRGNNRLLNNTS